MAASPEVSREVAAPRVLSTSSVGRNVALVAFLVLIVAVIATVQLAELALPLSTDQALYSLVGQAVHHGAVPYREYTDLKPPGIFYLRAALGVVPGADAWSSPCAAGPLRASCGWLEVKAWDIASTLAFGATVFALARALGLERSAALIAGGLGAAYVTVTAVSQLGLSPEKLAVMCSAFGVLLALHRRWWLAGVAVGVGVLMKQPAALDLVPVLVLSGVRWWRVVIGFAAPLALASVVLAWQGALPQAAQYVIGINLERIATPASLGGFGGDTALQSAWQVFRDGLAPFWLLGGIGLLALAAPGLSRRARVTLLVWASVDALCLARLREFMQLAPSVAVLGAWGATRLLRGADRPPHLGVGARWSARAALGLAMASVVLLSATYQQSIVMRALNERGPRGFVRSPDELVADELGHVPAGPLFVWGNGAELYLLSNRAPAASSLNVIALSANLPGAGARRDQLMAQLRAQPPEAIAISPEATRAGDGLELRNFAALGDLLSTSYVEDEVLRDPRFGGWRLFTRPPAAPSGRVRPPE
jgi:hypothetical protein